MYHEGGWVGKSTKLRPAPEAFSALSPQLSRMDGWILTSEAIAYIYTHSSLPLWCKLLSIPLISIDRSIMSSSQPESLRHVTCSESSSSSSWKEQLLEAARQGDVARLQQLLRQGVEAGGEQVIAGGAPPPAGGAASNSRSSTTHEPRSSCCSSSSRQVSDLSDLFIL